MTARIMKWLRGLRRRQQERREELAIIAAMRKQGHFAPYSITVGSHLVAPRAKNKKRVKTYVEWRAVFRNGQPYRGLVTCPYCGGRARLGQKHPCKRAEKTFVIHRPGYYESPAL